MLCLDLFNKYKFKLTVSVLGSGCRLAVLHPDSLHPDSLHGDQVCDGGLIPMIKSYWEKLIPVQRLSIDAGATAHCSPVVARAILTQVWQCYLPPCERVCVCSRGPYNH